MAQDQKIARIFGVLFILTFITSIGALALFQSVLDDPAAYIAGGGKETRSTWSLSGVPARPRPSERLSFSTRSQDGRTRLSPSLVGARIIESVFIATGSSSCSECESAHRRSGADPPPPSHPQRLHSLRPRNPPLKNAHSALIYTSPPPPPLPLNSAAPPPLFTPFSRTRPPRPPPPPPLIWASPLLLLPPDALPTSWQRLLALSGVAFAVLFVLGWFLSGGNAPDYTAADQDWTDWADDNQWKSRIGAFLMLLAGLVFLPFAGTIRSVLGGAEATVGGSVQLARVAFAGGLVGITGITIAIVTISAATTVGADADPVVSRALGTAVAGPYFVAAMGFAVMLAAAGLLTLRSGVFARWLGIVALLGALAFVLTFFALIRAPAKTASLATAFFLASWRSRSGRSRRVSRATARWGLPPACPPAGSAAPTRLPTAFGSDAASRPSQAA